MASYATALTGDEVATVNILIVDDEPANLNVLESVLSDPGYRLIRAENGSEALMVLMSEEFAVLVLDVRMPDMSGFELAQIIKQRRKTSHVPIIFLTAFYSEDHSMIEGYASGAVDYLHKPVNAAVLRSKVAVFAELYRQGRAIRLAHSILSKQIQERLQAEERLSELNATLEKRVIDRTESLQQSELMLQDAHRRKDEFLATLAHELRNPLAPLRNAVQILRMSQMAAEKLQWASEMIDRQVHAMSHLIDDLMDVSRISQGKIELRLAKVELGHVLSDAIDASRPILEEGGHQLKISLLSNRLFVRADFTRLVQVFLNLLNNAAKYMESGGTVDITVLEAAGEVIVTVTDSGIGIQEDRLENIFEMFSQVETALVRSRGGIGVGLALTKRLTQMHGGTVRASSQGLGKGSQFTVTLPLLESAPSLQMETPKALPSSSQSSADQPMRVLVADDNKDSASALSMLFEHMGFEVMKAYDGAAAVEVVNGFDPHLVLLDIGMPKLNGYEACRAMRMKEGGDDRTIVAITGWGQTNDKLAAKDAGFDRHMIKPVDPKQLFELLAEVRANGNKRLGPHSADENRHAPVVPVTDLSLAQPYRFE